MDSNFVVKMMHSFSHYPFEDIKMIAEDESVTVPDHVSKVELIALILIARAEREARGSVYKMVRETDTNRDKYCLRTEDEKYHLRLTTEQATMLNWCVDNEVNFYNAELESVGEVEWEIP